MKSVIVSAKRVQETLDESIEEVPRSHLDLNNWDSLAMPEPRTLGNRLQQQPGDIASELALRSVEARLDSVEQEHADVSDSISATLRDSASLEVVVEECTPSESSSTHPHQCSICWGDDSPTIVLDCCGDGINHNLKLWCHFCIMKTAASQCGSDRKCPFCRSAFSNSIKWSVMMHSYLERSAKEGDKELKKQVLFLRSRRPWFFIFRKTRRGAVYTRHIVCCFGLSVLLMNIVVSYFAWRMLCCSVSTREH